jgi:heme A synthase
VVTTAGLVFMVILFGGQVANFHAWLRCLGFPLCNGGVLPPTARLAALHWTRRLLAFGFLVSRSDHPSFAESRGALARFPRLFVTVSH